MIIKVYKMSLQHMIRILKNIKKVISKELEISFYQLKELINQKI